MRKQAGRQGWGEGGESSPKGKSELRGGAICRKARRHKVERSKCSEIAKIEIERERERERESERDRERE